MLETVKGGNDMLGIDSANVLVRAEAGKASIDVASLQASGDAASEGSDSRFPLGLRGRGRRGMLGIMGAALAVGAAACGVSSDEFSAAKAETDKLKAENKTLEKENQKLKKELTAAHAAGGEGEGHGAAAATGHPRAVPRANVKTTFIAEISKPEISPKAYVDEKASVIGRVTLSDGVYMAPVSSVRGDEGTPIFVGVGTNIQDGVVIHALETFEEGEEIAKNQVIVNGTKYAVYVGSNTSLAHECQVHGPASVGDHTFIGMQALVFKASVGNGCVLEPAAKVIGVKIADGRYVPSGMVVTSQEVADGLPLVTPDYAFATLNDGVLHVNQQLVAGYGGGKAAGH